MVTLLVAMQASWVGRIGELQAMGLPDWRGPALTAAIAGVLDRSRGALPAADAALLGRFVADLPRRFADVASCGLPDTLVHGDFHPGNFRGTAGRLALLDWGDSGIGHPLLDQPAFLTRIAARHVRRSARIGTFSGAVRYPDPTRLGARSCSRRSPPPGRLWSTRDFSTTSNRRSVSIIAATLPTGCSEPRYCCGRSGEA